MNSFSTGKYRDDYNFYKDSRTYDYNEYYMKSTYTYEDDFYNKYGVRLKCILASGAHLLDFFYNNGYKIHICSMYDIPQTVLDKPWLIEDRGISADTYHLLNNYRDNKWEIGENLYPSTTPFIHSRMHRNIREIDTVSLARQNVVLASISNSICVYANAISDYNQSCNNLRYIK